MSRVADVVVVGSLNLDVMVRAPALPRLGETMLGSDVALKPGGKGGNQAVEAARHETRVAMIAATGDDQFGEMLRTHLRQHGVDAGFVSIHAGVASGMSVAITEPGGDYAAIIVSGANLRLSAGSPAEIAVISSARWLLLQNEAPDAANLAAATAARAAGCRVILNAAPARPLPDALTALVDILVVNALEAEDLCGTPVTDAASAQAASTALCKGFGCAIVTAGGNGLAIATRDGLRRHIAAHAVVVRSTHGAGDALVGALAARLAAGDALVTAARYANAAAALLIAAKHDGFQDVGPDAVQRLLAGT